MTSQFDARYHLQQSVVKKGSLVCFQESSEYHHQGQFIKEVLRIGFQSCFPRTIDNLYQWVLILSIVLNKHLSTHLYSASNQVTSSLIANLTVGDVRPLLNVQFHIQTANLVTIIVALQVQRLEWVCGWPSSIEKVIVKARHRLGEVAGEEAEQFHERHFLGHLLCIPWHGCGSLQDVQGSCLIAFQLPKEYR